MAKDNTIIPDAAQEPEDAVIETEKDKKVSYKKTRDFVSSKYSPKHFHEGEAEKTYRQIRLERVRISIRKIKRLNLAMTVLTTILLFALFIGASIIMPRTVSAVNPADYDDKTLTVDFVGDVMFGRYINRYAEANGSNTVFEGASSYFKNADLAFVNLESAVLKDDVSSYSEAEKNIHLYCNYNLIEAAREAGVNVFGLANNHGFDYGNRPVEELIDYFRSNNIYYSGIGTDINDAARYTVIDCNGYRIAFIAITDVFYKEACAGPDNSGVFATTYGDYNQLVHEASLNSDITIVYFHWGEENEMSRNREQINLGHRMIDSGADIIIGSHPHVLQEVEKYKDGMIFYSMGNFIFDQGTTYSRDTVLVELTLDKSGRPEFTLIPMRIDDGIPEVTNNALYRTRINRELTQGLKQNDYYLGSDGFIHVKYDKAFTRTADEKAAAEAASQPTEQAVAAAPSQAAQATEALVPSATQRPGPAPTSTVPEPESPSLQAPPTTKPTQAKRN